MADDTYESPYMELIDARPRAVADRPEYDAALALAPRQIHENRIGGVHGGIIAGMLDSVMATAVLSGLPSDTTIATISMTVTYFSAARHGEELVALAEVRKRGRAWVMVEADVVQGASEREIAHGVATYAIHGQAP